MPRFLPPLNSLRAFEAAGRLLSFSKAAAELHVTPAAISHQIRGLEDYLHVQLFRRSTRRLFLTEPGQLALNHFREGFDRLAKGVDALRTRGERGVLTVSTAPSFAAKWLVPRLGAFAQQYPEIDLRLAANTALVDFDRDNVDAAIRFGRGIYDGLASYKLFEESLTPMLNPKLVGRRKSVKNPADLAQLPLLHDDSVRMTGRQPGWADWFKLARVADADTSRGIHFDDGHLVLQAAAEGRGVALGRVVLAAADLASGALVAPFSITIALNVGYYLVVPETRSDQPSIAVFRRWISEEAEAFAPVLLGLTRNDRRTTVRGRA
jgi:LysR family transcriptional regulator, glycine cleavage system transcriptional activator